MVCDCWESTELQALMIIAIDTTELSLLLSHGVVVVVVDSIVETRNQTPRLHSVVCFTNIQLYQVSNNNTLGVSEYHVTWYKS
jgi:hypothetical protein